MKFTTTQERPSEFDKGVLLVGIYENGELTPAAKELDKSSKGAIRRVLDKGAFTGKYLQTFSIFDLDNKHDWVLLVGAGRAEKLDASRFRRLVFTAIRALGSVKITNVVCFLTELKLKESIAWKCKQITELVHDALYRFDNYKTDKEPEARIETVTLYVDGKHKKESQQAIAQGEAVAAGVAFTKNLANLPSNICTPTYIANSAKELAKTYDNFEITVLNESEMKKLGMGALLGVSQGSAEEAKLVCLQYRGTNKKSAPVALIGKGVTFDTGGNSLKPPDSMVGMKYDMCGAATVLGTLKAVAELELPINVVGIIPTVENMPGGSAYKPEDILTSMSGQTIEVISTDAEGRLILADALTYAQQFKPDVMIDIATLTGAVVIALGAHATGLLTNHDPLAKDLLAAGLESHDRAWQLPLWDEYQEQIKSPFADMANTGGRSAGSITAGCFLSRFAKETPWAHLDVAGTAAMMSGTMERNATGRPVPLLVQYLLNRAS